ncbi:MAG: hypothetical protein ACTTHG_02880 [Treponemataceae bacterium]
MILNVSKKLTFIPNFNKNKECDPTDQIAIVLKNPTIQMKNRISSTPETVARADTSGKIEGIDIRLKTDDVAVLNAMVESLSNCSYEDEDGKHSITNVKQLLESPVEFSPLIDEIIHECNKILSREIDEKN